MDEKSITTPIDSMSAVNANDFTHIKEGSATVLFPSANEVFYNPVQEFNRDMSIATIQTWIAQEWPKVNNKKKTAPTVLEALAATGLRSIRYAKEIEGIGPILTNDLEPMAVTSINRNFAFNGLKSPEVLANLGDACDVMYKHRNPKDNFDIVDLDPYGTASPFIDAAVQSISDGGLLCVTCTDLAVLASNQHSETCYVKYGGVPLKAGFCHEAALRMVIHMIMTAAARYKRAVIPLMSCSIDFYVRIFVKVIDSPFQCKHNAHLTSLMYRCSGCGSFQLGALGGFSGISEERTQPKFGANKGPPVNAECEFCQFKHHVGGPLYSGPIHNKEFVLAILNHVKQSGKKYGTRSRMEGMLTVISEELDEPLFYLPSELSSVVRSSTPSYSSLRSALLNANYQVSTSHCAPGSLKTDAPNSFLWDIFRHFIKENDQNANLDKFSQGSPGLRILKNPSTPDIQVSFKKHPLADLPSRKIKLVRYQINPTKNWGPKGRHKRTAEDTRDKGAIENPVKAEKLEVAPSNPQ